MRGWFRARWRAYLDTLDPVATMSGSAPAAVVFSVLFLTAVYFSLAYLPSLEHLGGFPDVWISVTLTWVAGAFTLTAWKHEGKGNVSAIATLLDNALYATGLAVCAVSTRGGVSIAMAVAHGFVLVLFAGQLCSFSGVLAASVAVPLAIVLGVYLPPLPVAFILACGVLGMIVLSVLTRTKRQLLERQRKLEEALGAADRIADESVQAALANTLLTLGHFLHELRNYQTAVSTNLQYIELESDLDSDAAAALQEAQQAQREQEALLRSTIADLKSRARPVTSAFSLVAALRRVASDFPEMDIEFTHPDFDFELKGNPEHLRVVLLNLVRNAQQAGAQKVRLALRLEPGGHAVQVVVNNDGPPVPASTRERLFDSFTVSTKPGGSGLGLYLARRYSELLGGRIAVADDDRGATFTIRLPGKMSTGRDVSNDSGIRGGAEGFVQDESA